MGILPCDGSRFVSSQDVKHVPCAAQASCSHPWNFPRSRRGIGEREGGGEATALAGKGWPSSRPTRGEAPCCQCCLKAALLAQVMSPLEVPRARCMLSGPGCAAVRQQRGCNTSVAAVLPAAPAPSPNLVSRTALAHSSLTALGRYLQTLPGRVHQVHMPVSPPSPGLERGWPSSAGTVMQGRWSLLPKRSAGQPEGGAHSSGGSLGRCAKSRPRCVPVPLCMVLADGPPWECHNLREATTD